MGFVTFHGLGLATAAGLVMTPRSTTERLVDAAVAVAPTDRPLRIADVGTGSGAIAAALAVALPRAEVVATDSSAKAVLLARANVARLGLGDRVTVLHASLLDAVNGPLDLVVANLPYLPFAEAGLHPDVADEPADAVFAAGGGLDPYRELVSASAERLSDDGAIAIQLRRRIVTAMRGELEALATMLGPPAQAAA
jgi:release factor glutamine methyltransferase